MSSAARSNACSCKHSEIKEMGGSAAALPPNFLGFDPYANTVRTMPLRQPALFKIIVELLVFGKQFFTAI